MKTAASNCFPNSGEICCRLCNKLQHVIQKYVHVGGYNILIDDSAHAHPATTINQCRCPSQRKILIPLFSWLQVSLGNVPDSET